MVYIVTIECLLVGIELFSATYQLCRSKLPPGSLDINVNRPAHEFSALQTPLDAYQPGCSIMGLCEMSFTRLILLTRPRISTLITSNFCLPPSILFLFNTFPTRLIPQTFHDQPETIQYDRRVHDRRLQSFFLRTTSVNAKRSS